MRTARPLRWVSFSRPPHNKQHPSARREHNAARCGRALVPAVPRPPFHYQMRSRGRPGGGAPAAEGIPATASVKFAWGPPLCSGVPRLPRIYHRPGAFRSPWACHPPWHGISMPCHSPRLRVGAQGPHSQSTRAGPTARAHAVRLALAAWYEGGGGRRRRARSVLPCEGGGAISSRAVCTKCRGRSRYHDDGGTGEHAGRAGLRSTS